jgi:hypothetical protein
MSDQPDDHILFGGLIRIARDAGKDRAPCGECYIQPGETCDLCGASEPPKSSQLTNDAPPTPKPALPVTRRPTAAEIDASIRSARANPNRKGTELPEILWDSE